MGNVLLRKMLLDLRGQVIGWGMALSALLVVNVLLFPMTAEMLEEIQVPEELFAFVGGLSDLTTFEGYMNSQYFGIAMLILAVFAIIAGTAALVGEERDGTLELLLAQPVSRTRLATAKMCALAFATSAIVLMTLAATAVSALAISAEVAWGRLMLGFVMLLLFVTVTGALAMMMSLLLGDRKGSGALVALLLVASYVLESLSYLVSELEPLRPFLLTTYYQGDNALVGDISLGYAVALVFMLVVSISATLYLFQRRDIGVGAGIQWRRKRPARTADLG